MQWPNQTNADLLENCTLKDLINTTGAAISVATYWASVDNLVSRTIDSKEEEEDLLELEAWNLFNQSFIVLRCFIYNTKVMFYNN